VSVRASPCAFTSTSVTSVGASLSLLLAGGAAPQYRRCRSSVEGSVMPMCNTRTAIRDKGKGDTVLTKRDNN
jgi:hypothetical protein